MPLSLLVAMTLAFRNQFINNYENDEKVKESKALLNKTIKDREQEKVKQKVIEEFLESVITQKDNYQMCYERSDGIYVITVTKII